MTAAEAIALLMDAAAKVEHGILLPPGLRTPLANLLRDAAKFADAGVLSVLEVENELAVARAVLGPEPVGVTNAAIRQEVR